MATRGTIVVVGATGLVGAKVVEALTAGGHDVRAVSRRTGVDVLTGRGVTEALSGASAVVDVTDSPSYEDAAVMEFFSAATENLVTAGHALQIGHHVALSVVGADRMPDSGYMRAKVVQERKVAGSGVPYTILRATQFFEFAGGIADYCTDGGIVRVPDALIQPIAATDVAAKLAAVAVGPAANGVFELGGPERFSFAEFIGTALTHRRDPRTVVTEPGARYFGTALQPHTLLATDDAARGTTRFRDWLAAQSS